MADADQPGSLEPEAVPTPRIVGMPAPGKRGPAGLSPRTNYSKANTTPSPVGDGGAAEQKSIEPPKVAGMRAMTMTDMVAGSLATALQHVKIASKDPAADAGQSKTAGAQEDLEDKVAAALEELAGEFEKAAEGDTHGSVATSPTTTGGGAKNPAPSGQGHASHIPPHNTGTVNLQGNHSSTSARVFDVTQPLAGPAPKMANLQNPLYKEGAGRMTDDERMLHRAAGRADAAGDKPASKALRDRLWTRMGERGKREKAIVPASPSSIERHGAPSKKPSTSMSKAPPSAAKKSPTGRVIDGILEDAPGGGRGGGGGRGVSGHFGGHTPKQLPGPSGKSRKGLIAGALTTLGLAGGGAVAHNQHQKALRAAKIRKGVAAGVAGATLLGGIAAARHAGKETTASELPSGHIPKQLPRGMDSERVREVMHGALDALGKERTSKKRLMAGGAALLAGGLAAGKGMHHVIKKEQKSLARKSLALGAGAGALAAGGAAAAHHAGKETTASDDPRVMDVLTSTSPGAGPTSLLSSNESATNFTRGQAYKNRVGELNKMLDENIGGSADTTLRQVLTSTSKADPKIAQVAQKTAADVLLQKMQMSGGEVLLGILGGLK